MVVDLHKSARDFTAEIQHLLNSTICTGVALRALILRPDVVLVGCGLSRDSLESRRFPVRTGRGTPTCWMKVSYRLCLDEAREYLTVVTSYFGIYADDDEDLCLCHVDYEREKADGYPEAHLQVYGTSRALKEWRGWGGAGELKRLHFPVGGRRFRPILEDVIEFMITERLVPPRAGWRDVVEDGRRRFMRKQLRAAIRRYPHIAEEALKEFGRE